MKLREHLKPYKELIAKLKAENRQLKGQKWLLFAECKLWETRCKLLTREIKKLEVKCK